jgi:hypothetical protein
MHEQLALRLLRRIMKWDEETATREYRWVRLMSRLKYDGYRDYLAGVRFAESLAGWLNQFDAEDRQAAYDFIKKRLIYFSPAEIQRLVEQLYPRFVEPRLRAAVAGELDLPSYMVWSSPEGRRRFDRKCRQTLFIGLSDGARLDLLRRTNAGALVNDQIVLATHIDEEKWVDLGQKLAESAIFAGEAHPVFEAVYLIDDFTGSGTTFVRQKKDGSWTGKAKKFWDALVAARRNLAADGKSLPLAERFSLYIHHYVSSTQAREAINTRLRAIAEARRTSGDWFQDVSLTEGLLLPPNTPITNTSDPAMWGICDKYYDDDLYERLKEHLQESGQQHVKHGYANAALPVVLEHNCPNNSVSLLWAETEGNAGHAMRPLFPRRHRHS